MTNWLEGNKVQIDELIDQGKSDRDIAKVLGIRPRYSGISRDSRFVALREYVLQKPELWLEPRKEQISKLWAEGKTKTEITAEIRLVFVHLRPTSDPRYIILGEFLKTLPSRSTVKPHVKVKKLRLRELFNKAKRQNHV